MSQTKFTLLRCVWNRKLRVEFHFDVQPTANKGTLLVKATGGISAFFLPF